MIDQEAPDLMLAIERIADLKKRGLQRVCYDVKRESLATVENTMRVYGIKAYYGLADNSNVLDAQTFEVYVGKLVNAKELTRLLRTKGFYRSTRPIWLIDGTYDADEEDDQAGTSWQETLKASKTSAAFHGGEPGKSADASVNAYEDHYVAFAMGNKVNHGWDENITSDKDVTAYFRTYGIDPDSGWRTQW